MSGSQLMRIAAALHVYGRRVTGQVWFAMQVAPPHDILGFAASRAEADKLLKAKPTGTFDVYGPFTAGQSPTYDNVLSVREHDCTCGSSLCALEARSDHPLPQLQDVTSVVLTVKWNTDSGEKSATYDVFAGTDPGLPRPDTIFLSRASSEAFMYPRYEIMFGKDHTAAIRRKLGDT